MDYLPLNDPDANRRNCRKGISCGKIIEPLLWTAAIGLTVFLIFQPGAVQPDTTATNMNAMAVPTTHSLPTSMNLNAHIPTAKEEARLSVKEGCFTLSREACCSHIDGREDQWGGFECMPSAPGKTFISGNVCEPWIAAVGPVGSCSVVSTKAGADSAEDVLKAEQENRAAEMEDKLLSELRRALKQDDKPQEAPKQKPEQEIKEELKGEVKLGAKLKAEQGGRIYGFTCALQRKMNQTCSMPDEATAVPAAASGTCGADCLKECNAVSPGHEAYCSSSCATYCNDVGCSLSKQSLSQVDGVQDMEDYFANLEGSASCKVKQMPAPEDELAHLKAAPEGCFKLSRDECCSHKDGRTDQWGGWECVPAAEGKTFFTGNVCEPALAAVGPVGSCASSKAAPAKATPSSKITLASAKHATTEEHHDPA